MSHHNGVELLLTSIAKAPTAGTDGRWMIQKQQTTIVEEEEDDDVHHKFLVSKSIYMTNE
jgi:hypothetical protein